MGGLFYLDWILGSAYFVLIALLVFWVVLVGYLEVGEGAKS